MANFYQLLGVTRAATAIEVKAAFQRKMKALEASPEHGEHRKNQEKMLQQAFLTLLDPGRRAKYDKQVDADAGPVVVLEEASPKGLSIVTMALVAAVLIAAVAGGWYVTHPSKEKQEAARKLEDERSRAAHMREQEGPRNKNPNPFRNGPPSAVKDQMMKNAIDRAAKDAQAPAKPGETTK